MKIPWIATCCAVFLANLAVADARLTDMVGRNARNMSVEGGQGIRISGELHSSGITNDVANAVVYTVRFADRDGRILQSGMLAVCDRLGEYFYLGGTVASQRFVREVLVPEGAVSATVDSFRNRPIGEYWVVDEGVMVMPEALRRRAPFSASWFRDRGLEFCTGGMNVVSLRFLLFAAIVLMLYFAVPARCQPWVLLGASAFFYSVFRLSAWVFMGLSVLSVYLCALLQAGRHGRLALSVTIVFNLALLVAVKYVGLLAPNVSIVVPLGISFYTLQAVAYCVDVARGDIPAERNPFRLALFLTFFPAVMQGPISRYGQLGPQLWSPHACSSERLRDGLQLMLWGFFKKAVIADRAAVFVDQVFGTGSTAEGFGVLVAVGLYSLQIYADFSGCVDLSRGIAQCLGIDLINNFNHPYFSESVAEFWRRWHISLSSWLRDYVYIPLGGNRHGMVRKYLNVLIVFAVSGLWHGTGLNFFVWGVLHGAYQIVGALTAPLRRCAAERSGIPVDSLSGRLARRIVTFAAVSFAWIFFRAESFSHACGVIRRMCRFNPWVFVDGSLFKLGLDAKDWNVLIVSVLLLTGVSWIQERMRVRQVLAHQALWLRWGIALAGLCAVAVFGMYGPGYSAGKFIYMQF